MLIFITSLAVYRLSYFLSEESGPFGIGDKLRKVKYLDELLNCYFCTSFWVALPFSFQFGDWLVYWFGLAGAAMLLYVLHEKL